MQFLGAVVVSCMLAIHNRGLNILFGPLYMYCIEVSVSLCQIIMLAMY